MPDTILQARWIVPVSSPPILNGQVHIRDGRIVALYPHQHPVVSASDAQVRDFGNAAILPGLVNAHTHLELSFLAGKLNPTHSMAQWVRAMTQLWPHGVPESALVASIRSGLEQSLAAGVTCIGDIGYGPHALGPWQDATQHVVGFLEVLGMGTKRHGEHSQSLERMVAVCEQSARQFSRAALCNRIGLSPHAPYSADVKVYQQAAAYAQRTRRPLCTHLAETAEEMRFLADGTGPLRDLLEQWGLWDGSFPVPGCSPVAYLEQLGFLQQRPLVIHANYVSQQDIELLAERGCSVVYCPRSHAFFGHGPHRYADMLAAGVNVCVGTDSLASNDSLSILDELRFMQQQGCTLAAAQLLELGTLAGARALGLERVIGSLEPGKYADLCVMPLDGDSHDPLADILASRSLPSTVLIRGEPPAPYSVSGALTR